MPTKNKRGFTLVELTIAITITSVIGLSIAGATVALSRANQDTNTFYQSLHTARSAMMRIQRTIYQAKLLTACTGTTVVLWAEDTNVDGKINADEVALIKLDADNREVVLMRQAFPAALAAALNVELKLSDITDAGNVDNDLDYSSYTQTTVLAVDVSDFLVTAKPNPPLTKLADIRLSVGTGIQQVTLRSASTMRGDKTGKVGVHDGKWVLTTN